MNLTGKGLTDIKNNLNWNKKRPIKPNYFLIGILMIGVVMMWFSLSCLYDRASIDIQGVIISRQTGHYDTIYRVYTDYTIQQDDGKVVSYRANSNDIALSGDIPIGSQLIKKKWAFDYTVDGKEITGFRLNSYSTQGVIGFSLFIIGLVSIIRYFIKNH